jgi:hypothetical protein
MFSKINMLLKGERMEDLLNRMILEIRKRGLRQLDVVKETDIRSESRLSRILRGHDKMTNSEIKSLNQFLSTGEDNFITEVNNA